ncbi:MAG: hypothetical protein ACKV22_10110 [Bryobacteraceae bacterium]
MPSASDVRLQFDDFRRKLSGGARRRDARFVARAALGTLLVLDIAAALFLFKPWGGSAEDLTNTRARLEQQLLRNRRSLTSSKQVLEKVEKGRTEGEKFLSQYIMDARTAYSTVIGELDEAAGKASIKIKDSQFSVEPVDGSDTIGMMTISANYEGEYPNLTQFVNLVDRSPKFLIMDTVQATPQTQGQAINVTMKLNVFIRNEGGIDQ